MLVPNKVSSSHLGRFAGWEVGPNGDGLPGVEVVAQGVELLTGQPQRFLAEEQVERRVRRFDGLDDRVGRADRVGRLLAALFGQFAADGASGGCVGGDLVRYLLRGASVPRSARSSRLRSSRYGAK